MYYYLRGETKMGPYSLAALKNEPLNASTLVWTSSLPDWVAANSLPELQDLFVKTATTMPPPYVANHNQQQAFGGVNVPPPMPDSYLVWAILATVLCCLPLGIVSIINAAKVASAYGMGDYTGAQKASDNAKKWAIWSAISAVVLSILYVVFMFVFGFAAAIADL